MGLSIHYRLGLPATMSRAEVVERLDALRAAARPLTLRVIEERFSTSAGESLGVGTTAPMQLEDAFRTWAWLQLDPTGDSGDVLPDAVGFAVSFGPNCEPAMFGLAWVPPRDAELNLRVGEPPIWHWHYSCKTQYASIDGDEHFVKCHTTLTALLDEAVRLGFDVDVQDEGGFWETRDVNRLLAEVHSMNRLVARFGGALHDAIGAQHPVDGAIFRHPDFERLETE